MTGKHLDLGTLRELAEEMGFRCASQGPDELVVDVCSEARLCFCNLPDDDVLVGFQGTEWHMHLPFTFVTAGGTFVEHDEATLLQALAYGELLVVESRLFGVITHRWLEDRRTGLKTEYLARGEELRVAADLFNKPTAEGTG